MEQVLIKEKKLEGKYVAIRNINDHTPVADGDNPETVYNKALQMGIKKPLLLYVPAQPLIF